MNELVIRSGSKTGMQWNSRTGEEQTHRDQVNEHKK